MRPSSWRPRRGLEPRIDRALRIFARRDEDAAARGAAALAHLLDGGGRAPEAWRSSRLTSDGYPLELTFCASSPALRYTVEVPAASARERLVASQQRLEHLGAPGVPAVLRDRLTAVSREGPLDYGAWIGARHGGDGDRYKLYCEVPRRGSPTADRLAIDYLGPNGPHRRHPIRMIGCDLSTSILELYFRADGPWPGDVPLSRARPATDDDPLTLLETGQPPAPCGFSFAISPTGHIVASSIFAFASQVFGCDAEARRRVLAFNTASRRALAGYAEMTRPLRQRTASETLHGMIACAATTMGPIDLRISLSPPGTEMERNDACD